MAKFPGLKVEKRDLFGRKVKQLRRQGIVPANLFGKKINSIAIQVEEKAFTKIFNEVGETGLVDVTVGDKKYPSLISGYVTDPVTGRILHADFHTVSLKEKVTAAIPVELVGEAPAVKEQGGVLFQSLNEIEVEALPTDLPESINVDISGLANIGDSITVRDLKVDAQTVTIQVEPDTTVVSIQEPAPEEVEEAPIETETTEQGPTTEPEAPAAE